MTLPTEMDRNLTQRLLAQLGADEFMGMLMDRTLFRDLPFENLPLTTLDEISNAAKLVPLARNSPLNLRKSESLYEIIYGYVKIYDRAWTASERISKNVKNPPALLAWRVPGELLGDFRFLDPKLMPDLVEATDDCLLLEMPARLVRKWAGRHPQIYINIARNLASKASKTRVRAQILRQDKGAGMIAKLFLELLAEREGGDPVQKDGQEWRLVKGTFHVEDIAAFLGYGKEGARLGIHTLMEEKVLDHHDGIRSGRYICNEAGLRKYLEQESSKQADKAP